MTSLPQDSFAVRSFDGPGEAWDAFASAQPGWTHFHRYGWRSVIEGAFGHECTYLAASRDGTLAGLLPLVRIRSRLFGDFLVSMPFLNYGGPLGPDDACRALANHAIGLADRAGADLLEFRSARQIPLDMKLSQRKISVLLDIPPTGTEALWDSFRAKLRSQIRRPGKEGVEVRFGTELVADFYRVFAENMRDLGTPVLGRELFDRIVAAFGDSAHVGVAYLAGRPIAAGWGFSWGSELEMTWASSLREFNRIAPNMLLYWRFIERAAAQDCTIFNFGRCTPGSTTHRFKLQWGSRDEPLWWYQHARGKAKTPSPDDAAFSWGPRVWSRLPLAVANFVGPRVVKYIP